MATAPGSTSNSFADWFTKQIGLATRWRSNSGDPNEGGVDVPEPAGTPIYALATGPLKGFGYFYHGGPFFSSQEFGAGANPGYGVVSEQVNVPGLGLEDLYYQHLDLANNFQFCASGNCGNQIVHAGDLLGYTRGDVGETEVGLGANKAWGNVWGNVSDPGSWLGDPRSAISNTIGGGSGPTGTKTNCVVANCYVPDWCCALPTAVQVVAPPCNCGGANPVGAVAGAAASSTGINAVGDFFSNLSKPSTQINIGIWIIAILLILGAIIAFALAGGKKAEQTPAGQEVTRVYNPVRIERAA